jgi:hypothetical protein
LQISLRRAVWAAGSWSTALSGNWNKCPQGEEISDLRWTRSFGEFEVLAAKAEPIGVFDTPKKRQREFEEELRRMLDDLKQEPSNPVWREVLMLLDFPQLRSKSR